jgi:hypothetical protein
MRKSNIEQKS